MIRIPDIIFKQYFLSLPTYLTSELEFFEIIKSIFEHIDVNIMNLNR